MEGFSDASFASPGLETDAFFSLGHLADFLRTAPLDLAMALNLDGGPVACQAIAVGGYRRDFCGQWELARKSGAFQLWTRLIGNRRIGLPIILAVLPK